MEQAIGEIKSQQKRLFNFSKNQLHKTKNDSEMSKSDTLSIEWKNINNNICLFFKFHGVFSHETSLKGVEEWMQRFAEKDKLKFIIVWDCINMNGYEPKARIVWQHALKELQKQIDTIWLISDSSIIRTGAKIISLATSFEIKPVSKEADILKNQSIIFSDKRIIN